MKKLLALALCVACGFASAQTTTSPQQPDPSAPQSQSHFDRAKAKRLAHINARISALQGIQACVQAATDMASLHACRTPGK
jgi:hypothetical protein